MSTMTPARAAEIEENFGAAATAGALQILQARGVNTEKVRVVSAKRRERFWNRLIASSWGHVVVEGPCGGRVEVEIDVYGGIYDGMPSIHAVGNKAELATREIDALLN